MIISTRCVPVDNAGDNIQLKPGEKLAYHARNFVWKEVFPSSRAADMIDFLETREGKLKLEILRSIQSSEQEKADCERRRMGAVVSDLSLKPLSYGHNRKPDELTGSCKEIGCVPAITCRVTNHAETEALYKLEPHGDKRDYAIINRAVPCLSCLKICLVWGVTFILYEEERLQDELDRPILSVLSLSGRFEFLKLRA